MTWKKQVAHFILYMVIMCLFNIAYPTLLNALQRLNGQCSEPYEVSWRPSFFILMVATLHILPGGGERHSSRTLTKANPLTDAKHNYSSLWDCRMYYHHLKRSIRAMLMKERAKEVWTLFKKSIRLLLLFIWAATLLAIMVVSLCLFPITILIYIVSGKNITMWTKDSIPDLDL